MPILLLLFNSFTHKQYVVQPELAVHEFGFFESLYDFQRQSYVVLI